MKTKKIIYISVAILAFVAVVVGLCLFFFASRRIDTAPNSVQVMNVDDEFFLVTEYSGQYSYKFRVEQNLGGQFVLIDTIESETNIISLSQQDFDIALGEEFRFSACFSQENSDGEFSEPVVWVACTPLQSVDTSTISYDKETFILSWGEVANADRYDLLIVDNAGNSDVATLETNSVSLDEVPVGTYTVFLFATSDSQGFLTSSASERVVIEVEKHNEIVFASVDENLHVTLACTQSPLQFEIYVDNALRGTLQAGDGEEVDGVGFEFVLTDARTLLYGVDFENSVVEIRSCANGYLLESEFVTLTLS